MSKQPGTIEGSGGPAWFGWPGVLALTFGLLVVRVVYQVWLSPFDLAADEAHYWDWSRHLSLSYYSKGPGIALLIRASTAMLGNEPWGVRIPAALASAVTMLVLARLGQRCAGGDARAAFLSAVVFCLVPGFLATSVLMTIDMPYVACWSLAMLIGLELFDRQDAGRSSLGLAAGLGLALGVGFLFKYTILLLVPGLVLFRVLRREGGAGAGTRWIEAAIAGVVMFVCMLPVLVWNGLHGWPTVAHLLGHLGLEAGDVPRGPGEGWEWSPLWLPEFVGSQIGIVGPMIVPMVLWGWIALRRPGRASSPDVFLASCAAPVLLVYLGVSVFTDAEANWTIAGYASLCVLVGRRGMDELARYREMVRSWKELEPPRPKRGMLRRKPETWFQIAFHWSIGYAAVVGLGLMVLPLLERVPVVADLVPTHRLMGETNVPPGLEESLRRVHGDRTSEALVIADRYNRASPVAHELYRSMGDGTPTVTCASAYLGDRATAYDHWSETDLRDPRWFGGTVHLVGGSRRGWERAFRFERIEEWADGSRILLGIGYGGPIDGGGGKAP